jgi:uncharacterized protein YdaU (DUF1376 family)
MHYYQFNIGDYASHTKGLSLIEDLAYRRLLDHYYLSEQPFNGRSTDVARLIGMREHADEVEYVLNTFFTRTDDGQWLNPRADKEIEAYRQKSEKAAQAGRASAERRFNNRSTDVQQTLNECSTTVQPTNNHKTITNNHKPVTKDIAPPDGVLESVWQDFVKQRKAKKAAITPTAIRGIEREARKAGISLNDALQEICARGWTGFKAEWIAKNNQSLSFAERDEQARRKRWEEMTGRKWPEDESQLIDITPTVLEIE